VTLPTFAIRTYLSGHEILQVTWYLGDAIELLHKAVVDSGVIYRAGIETQLPWMVEIDVPGKPEGQRVIRWGTDTSRMKDPRRIPFSPDPSSEVYGDGAIDFSNVDKEWLERFFKS
jgi:hypothetical protein